MSTIGRTGMMAKAIEETTHQMNYKNKQRELVNSFIQNEKDIILNRHNGVLLGQLVEISRGKR